MTREEIRVWLAMLALECGSPSLNEELRSKYPSEDWSEESATFRLLLFTLKKDKKPHETNNHS